jgi:hypothetical protein
MTVDNNEYFEMRLEALESMPLVAWQFKSVSEHLKQRVEAIENKCGIHTGSLRSGMSDAADLMSSGVRFSGKSIMAARRQAWYSLNLRAFVLNGFLLSGPHQNLGAITLFKDHFSVFEKLRGEFG